MTLSCQSPFKGADLSFHLALTSASNFTSVCSDVVCITKHSMFGQPSCARAVQHQLPVLSGNQYAGGDTQLSACVVGWS